MLVRPSLYAGLLTGAALLVAVLVALVWRSMTGALGTQFLPLVLAPLVVTGIVAVRRATPWIARPADAALAGALAGLVTALMTMPSFYLAMFVQVAYFGVA